jgi:hypothetical protein
VLGEKIQVTYQKVDDVLIAIDVRDAPESGTKTP